MGVLCLMYLVLYIDRVGIATAAPRMSADFRLSHTAFGLAISAFAWPYALFQLLGGSFSALRSTSPANGPCRSPAQLAF